MSKAAIGGDHAGFELKEVLIKHLESKGIDVQDMGPHSSDSVDYPDFAHPVANQVATDSVDFGILICGSANGVCMTANKHPKVRAGIAWIPEIAALAKQHNNANLLCLPARYLKTEEAKAIVDAYLNSDFEGGRHQRRVDKISKY